MSCINVEHLSKLYGSVKAVDDIVLSVKSGLVFGFLGPNGAGKSTTIKLLTTLIPPSSGSLTILGINAIENSLDKYGMMWNVPKIDRKKRMEELLKDFDLVDIRKKRNEDLSIGQRRRVQVAREFMHDMDLLFLDEQTVGLDPSARRKLLDYLRNKVKTGLTIFYTTHILSEAEYLCDEIAIIDKGKILTVDTPDALKKRFGKEKTIKIHLLEKQNKITTLLSDITDCKIDFDNGTNIVIRSEQSELVLLQVLRILNDNQIEVEDLSAVPTNLEEIFLKMVSDNTSNN